MSINPLDPNSLPDDPYADYNRLPKDQTDPLTGGIVDPTKYTPAPASPTAPAAPTPDPTATPTAPTPAGGAPGSMGWIQQQLSAVQSSDDPNFWFRVISADPKVAAGDASAIAYWVDRIRRGDGSALIKNGTLQPFQDGGQPAPSGSVAAPGGSAGAVTNPYLDQIRQLLLQQIQGAKDPVDPNAPEIAQPFQAASLTAQQQQTSERKALAERLYASGGGDAPGSSNELTQGIQQSAERTAGNLAGIKSDLISRVYQNKQAQLQQALSLATQTGDQQSALQIQQAIAQLQNAYQYAALGQQQGQFNDQYGLSLSQLQYQRDRDAARAAAGLAF